MCGGSGGSWYSKAAGSGRCRPQESSQTEGKSSELVVGGASAFAVATMTPPRTARRGTHRVHDCDDVLLRDPGSRLDRDLRGRGFNLRSRKGVGPLYLVATPLPVSLDDQVTALVMSRVVESE